MGVEENNNVEQLVLIDRRIQLNNNNNVPEPGALALLGFGLATLVVIRRQKLA